MILASIFTGAAMGVGGALVSIKKQRAAKQTSTPSILKMRPTRARRAYQHGRLLLSEMRGLILEDRQQGLHAEIDPHLRAAAEKMRKENKRRVGYSLGAIALAAAAPLHPIMAILSIAAIVYTSKYLVRRIVDDYKRGCLVSAYLINVISIFGLIVSGNLILAAVASLFGGFFASLIDRIEKNAHKQLVNVFADQPDVVWIVKDGVEIQVPIHEVQAGDIVMIAAGEVIPVDGVVEFGFADVDQSLLNGESQPAEKGPGEEVFCSTLVLSGRIGVLVRKSGEETLAARIGRVLNETQTYKGALITRGRKMAEDMTPAMLAFTAGTYALLGVGAAVSVSWSSPGRSLLALGPLSLLSYLQILAREGVLVKDGRVFDRLHRVDTVVFDKTGTLTLEQPVVGKIHAFDGCSEAEVVRLAASAERRQTHPIARAILAEAERRGVIFETPDASQYVVGHGIKVSLGGATVRAGSLRFLRNEGLSLPDAVAPLQAAAGAQGHSIVYVSLDDALAGALELRPRLRPEAEETIRYLKRKGVKTYILSGDQETATKTIAERLGVDAYFAETLPEDKAALIERLKAEGAFVCFIGDGVNDAIALKAAQVSVSLKGASSAATDTASIVLMDGTLKKLRTLFVLMENFEKDSETNKIISIAPGVVVILGVYLLSFGVATGMFIFYLSFLGGLFNTIRPLANHRNAQEKRYRLQTNASTPIPSSA